MNGLGEGLAGMAGLVVYSREMKLAWDSPGARCMPQIGQKL